jgi:hypothetical protein
MGEMIGKSTLLSMFQLCDVNNAAMEPRSNFTSLCGIVNGGLHVNELTGDAMWLVIYLSLLFAANWKCPK